MWLGFKARTFLFCYYFRQYLISFQLDRTELDKNFGQLDVKPHEYLMN